jgi:acyl-homoserine lactone acylase PvdQ
MKRCLVLAAVVLCILAGRAGPASAFPPGTGRYQQFGDAAGFLNVLPPGQDGVMSLQEFNQGAGAYLPHMRDQQPMYADLVYNTPGLPESRLSDFYKDASFGVPDSDIERVYSPVAGVTVVRDRSYGVAHIFGDTRYATMFAQGYTAAEDRLFAMDVLRHLGRARLSEFLGATAANQSLDREQLADAPYTEADLTAQLTALEASGPEGQAIADDGQAYTDGVNLYITEALLDPAKLPVEYTLLGVALNPWVPEDILATASKVGAIFGKGGGGEVRNHCGLKDLAVALGNAPAARAVFDDFHFANDAEAVTTSQTAAPYMTNLGPVNPAAHPDIDCATLDPVIDNPMVAAAPASTAGTFVYGDLAAALQPHDMSNALLVSGANSVTGRPIAVFGPQTGYFMPQLLVEKDVHGPGIDARGAAFAGADQYVQLGRGTNYAWSATSSSADNSDQWVLQLCEPLGGPATITSMGYLHNSVCKTIETYQHTQATTPAISWRVERTADYGSISERGLLEDGTPIAIAKRRSTYGNELGSARGFYRVNDPAKMANGFADFQSNMGGGIDYSFNWFYVDDTDIGYQHSCKCPQRATGVDPYLPAWGTGAWDWQSFIPLAAQPTALNPAQGYLSSWNNKQAPQFMANDRSFSEGPVQRVQMLNTRIAAAIIAGPLDRADLVDAMEDAGTVDLRGQEVLSLLLQIMGPTAPGTVDVRAQDMRDRLAAWVTTAAHRRDLNHDGAYDDPQPPAIMDTWWPLLVSAMFDTVSGNAIANLGMSIHDAPQGHNGSAFGGGAYSHVQKDLRQVLGQPVVDPFSQTYCGSGNLAACATALWSALGQAAPLLQTEFASPNVVDWKRTIASDEIRSSALGIATSPPFHWINRPTFQQVVQIGGGCVGDSDCDGVATSADNCPMAANAPQTNTDRNFIDQTPPSSQDDRTWPNSDGVGDACDPDDDNDGLADATESGVPPCASATAPTNPLLRDTDGDRVLDGAECALGTNPASAASKPSAAACGLSTDTDGDRLSDRAEVCGYNTSAINTDTDVDNDGFPVTGATKDGCEAASLNNDRVVNSGDQLLLVLEIIREPSPSLRLVSMDINKDGGVNSGDQLLVAQFLSPTGQCP